MRKISLLILALISAFALTSCSFDKDNTTPPAPVVKFKPSINVKNVWSVQATHGSSKYYLRLTPGYTDDVIIVNDYDGNVTGVNAKTGAIVWKVDVDSDLTSGIDADNGKAFVATEDGHVLALNAKTGAQLWKAPVSSEVLATPTTVRDIVLVKSIDGTVTALSTADGRQLWKFTQNVPSLILHASSRPVVAGNYVVAGFANGRLAVLNLSNGRSLWVRSVVDAKGITDVERMVDIDASPVVIRGVVYVATYRGNIVALYLKSGRLMWRHKISSYTGIAADYSHLYLSDAKSYVWGFDDGSGAVMWRQSKLLGRKVTAPVILGDYVIVADGYGYVHWMSKRDGHFVARSRLGKKGIIANPKVVGNTLYIYTADGVLYAFQKK